MSKHPMLCSRVALLMRMAAGFMLFSPSLRAAVTFTAGNESVAPGGAVSLPISVSGGFTSVSAFQFTLSWTAAELTLNPTTPVTLSSFLAGGTSTTGTPDAGTLTFLWDTGGQVTIADNTTIFWVEFSAAGQAGTSVVVRFTDDPTPRLVTFSDTTEVMPLTVNGSVTIVPEPVNYALVLFAAVLVGMGGVRWIGRGAR